MSREALYRNALNRSSPPSTAVRRPLRVCKHQAITIRCAEGLKSEIATPAVRDNVRLGSHPNSNEECRDERSLSGAMALTYATLGDKDQAFLWLEKAYAEKSSFRTSLKFWSVFDPLRSDPRFADLLNRVGLPL